MRLSTSTCIYFNRPDGTKADLHDSIRACGQAGYRVMDMNWHDCAVFRTPFWDADWEDWVKSLKETACQAGVSFSQSHAHFFNYCDSTLKDRPWLDETVRRSIVGSSMLGIPWMVIHAATDWESDHPLRDSKRKAVEYFKPVIEQAGELGVGVAIENLWEMNIAPKRRYTACAEELMDLVDSLPYPNVGVCWDLEHSAIMQQDPMQVARMLGPKLKATHVSDYYDKIYDHVLPFQGLSDWDAELRALACIDYQGDFTYEAHRCTMRLPVELVPAALRYSVDLGNYLIGKYNHYKEERQQA